MSNQRSLEALEKLELIAAVQATRTPTDAFSLTTALFNLVHSRKSTLAAVISAASLAEGDRAGASAICRACLDTLAVGHRAGINYLAGLLPASIPVVTAGDPPHISEPLRLQQYERYGFESGEVGRFTDARIEEMARLAPVAAATAVDNPAWHYPQALLDFIAGHYATLQAHQTLATGGSRVAAVAAVAEATDAAEAAIARVRGFYISASDDGDRTPQLKRIGLQPRRLPGEAGPGVVPGVPGTAVLDSVAKTVTIPAMPEDASSIHCYRQKLAAGATPAGPVEMAGISLSTVVGYIQAGPLLPGAEYEVWVVGFDGVEEGSPGNRLRVVG